MSVQRKYEIMILLTEEFNDSELKTWVFNYAKNLRKFNISDISVISRGKHNLAYSINNKGKGNYIHLSILKATEKVVKVIASASIIGLANGLARKILRGANYTSKAEVAKTLAKVIASASIVGLASGLAQIIWRLK